jgi:hypothetical protein
MPGVFCFLDDFKGTAAQDLWPLFFRESTKYKNNLGYELGIRLIHEKNQSFKNLVLLSLKGKFLVSTETDSSKNIFG